MPGSHRIVSAGPILVVEDDDDTRDALCQLLFGQGHHVIAASNGLEALEILAKIQPGLIITDLSMPIMTGWQLLERLGRDTALCAIPVIVLSADNPPPEGHVCFLQKPASAAHLLREIGERVVAPVHQAKIPAA